MPDIPNEVTNYLAPSASGYKATWTRWDGSPGSSVDLRWENEGWTAEIGLHIDDAVAVVRMSASWVVQQLLLFRDLPEPDLWLATDGHGRWGEMNGEHRTELDGCIDIDFAGTPFTNSIITHRLPLHVGHTADLKVITIDVETLGVVSAPHRYTRHDTNAWEYTSLMTGKQHAATVDEFGIVTDEHSAFRRTDI